MGQINHDCQACGGRKYIAILDVSEAIVLHRDLPSLFHDLAGRLRQVAQFDYLSLVLYDASTNTMRLHVLEPCVPTAAAVTLADAEREHIVGVLRETGWVVLRPRGGRRGPPRAWE